MAKSTYALFCSKGSYQPLQHLVHQQTAFPRSARTKRKDSLVDHQRADVNQLALDRPILDQGVLLVEERHELRAVVAAIALGGEDELARLVLCELLALEEDLERRPDRGGGRERAVHVDGAEGEAGADGLVDVDD